MIPRARMGPKWQTQILQRNLLEKSLKIFSRTIETGKMKLM
jgi:hypothetical protein